MAPKASTANPDQLALRFEPPAAGPGRARPFEPPVADAAERREALDPARSFIVQAPAGSGKTGLLIQRYLVLLARVRVPEEVVALTFTRKAAGEMRSRVLQALRDAREGSEPQSDHAALTLQLAQAVLERDAQEGWGLEANPGRLHVQTIDALCASLTRQMPLLSRLGPVPRVAEDAEELYREAARETLALLEEDGYAEQVAALLRHLDNQVDRAEEMLAALLRKRDQWWRHLGGGGVARVELEHALEQLACERMRRARGAAPAVFVPNILQAVRYAAVNLARSQPHSPLPAWADLPALPEGRIADLPAWRGIAELLLTRDGKLRKTVDRRKGFPSQSEGSEEEKEQRRRAKQQAEQLLEDLVGHEEFVEALVEIHLLPPPAYDDRQWAFIDALIGLLPIAQAQLTLVFQRRGTVDFAETTQGALRALGEPDAPTDLALALDYRIQHLLIDEFQDTSLTQFELLQRLTAGWQAGDGRTVFAVGDPMQSIYRFREAEVGLFLRARHRGLGGIPLESLVLQVNFRSQAGLVEWVNDVFPAVLAEREDVASGAVPFVRALPQEAALPGPSVHVHASIGDDPVSEAQTVVELVRRALGKDPQGSIALLVRGRAHLREIVPRVKEAGLRLRAIEIEALGHRPAVRDLYALTRALLHPADRAAWLSVLRAPWCGLTLTDLEALVADVVSTPSASEFDSLRPASSVLGSSAQPSFIVLDRTIPQLLQDPDRVAALSVDGVARLARVMDAIGPVLANRGRSALRRRVEAAWLRLGGPACASDPTDVEDAQVFLDLLDELEQGGDLEDHAALDEHLARLYALPDLHAPETLQAMTIHKSKGLEFDTVILTGLGRGVRGSEAQLLQWLERPGEDGRGHLLLAAITEQGRSADPIYRCVTRMQAEREQHEAGRLLYVAATRARKRLHLVGHAGLDEKTGEARAPAKRTLLSHLWGAVEPEFQSAARRLAAEQAVGSQGAAAATPGQGASVPAERLPQRIWRLDGEWRLPPVPVPVPWREPAAAVAAASAASIEFDWAGETARHVGTVVHRYLQRMAEEGLERWDAERVGAAGPILRAALRAEGVPAPELGQATGRVQRALEGVVADARGRWILEGGHADAANELRLTARLDGETINVVLDRTFVDAQGTRWIVDYKTGTHEGGDLESFLDREQERYREQLERYAKVMTGLDARPVRLALYFPLLRAWREWAAPP